MTCFSCDHTYQVSADELKNLSPLDREKLISQRGDEARWTISQGQQAITIACVRGNEPEARRLAAFYNDRFKESTASVFKEGEVLTCTFQAAAVKAEADVMEEGAATSGPHFSGQGDVSPD